MQKWLLLSAITLVLLVVDYHFSSKIGLHPLFDVMTLFFTAQTFVLFRLDGWVAKEWVTHLSMVKIGLRLFLSMGFVTVLLYLQEDQAARFSAAIQFIGLYFGFMVFEIVVSLTNLRRN